tara:strand:+ start:312 stop:491 length:180 start_codon:yes stop_codon:yes gene_type:complete
MVDEKMGMEKDSGALQEVRPLFGRALKYQKRRSKEEEESTFHDVWMLRGCKIVKHGDLR